MKNLNSPNSSKGNHIRAARKGKGSKLSMRKTNNSRIRMLAHNIRMHLKLRQYLKARAEMDKFEKLIRLKMTIKGHVDTGNGGPLSFEGTPE